MNGICSLRLLAVTVNTCKCAEFTASVFFRISESTAIKIKALRKVWSDTVYFPVFVAVEALSCGWLKLLPKVSENKRIVGVLSDQIRPGQLTDCAEPATYGFFVIKCRTGGQRAFRTKNVGFLKSAPMIQSGV